MGNEGRGIAHITPMLTITRLHNSVISAGFMRRILQLSRDYATKRTVFGKYLADQPLHMHTLAKMEVSSYPRNEGDSYIKSHDSHMIFAAFNLDKTRLRIECPE